MTEGLVTSSVNLDEITYDEISDPAVMNKHPLVSVHMLTYNHEPYIAQAIEGVLMQKTDFPIELVIGEDCSTDRTREIVMKYQRKQPAVIRVVLWDKNVGAHRNSQKLNELLRGKYVAFNEGDDYWTHPKKLQMQVDRFEENPDVVLQAHGVDVVDVDRSYIRAYSRHACGIIKPEYLIMKGSGFLHVNSMMMKKNVFDDKPGWFYKFSAGDTAILYLGLNKGLVLYDNTVMSCYRQNVPGSWTSGARRRFFLRNPMKTQCALVELVWVGARHPWAYLVRSLYIWLWVFFLRPLMPFYARLRHPRR